MRQQPDESDAGRPTARPGAPVPIAVRKYDGRQRFVVETRCLARHPGVLVLQGEPGRALHTAGATHRLPTATLEYFPAGRWYNVLSFFDPASGAFQYHFCNIIAPVTWVGDTLAYVDLDLDLRVSPGGHALVEDLDEFRQHARRWRYPATLRRAALAALREVRALATAGVSPFTTDSLELATTHARTGPLPWLGPEPTATRKSHDEEQ